MVNFKRILFPVDFTPQCQIAARTSRRTRVTLMRKSAFFTLKCCRSSHTFGSLGPIACKNA